MANLSSFGHVSPRHSSGRSGLGAERYLHLFERLTPLIGSHDRDQIARQSCELISEMLGVEACSLMMLSDDQTRLEMLAATHIPSERWRQISIPRDEGISGKVLRDGKAQLVGGSVQFRKLFGRESDERYQSAACVVVPFAIRGWMSGVINVARPVGRRSFLRRDLDLLQAAATLIASAMAHALQNLEVVQLQRNLEDIFDGLHVGILSVSNQELVTHLNQRARRLLALNGHIGSAAPLSDVLPGTIYNICRRLMREANGRTEPAQDRVSAVASDGSPRLLAVTVSPLRCLGGGLNDHLIMLEDVGQEEEVNRLREAESMKQCFLAIISHELRTPLAVIRGAVPLIDPQTSPKPETLGQVHDLLMKNCKRLNSVVSAILDVTEIENGTLNLTHQSVDLGELLTEVIQNAEATAATKQVLLHCEVGDSIIPIHADRRRLRQVLSELVNNAIKFSYKGKPVTVSAQVAPPWIEIRVTDVGPKIEASERREIFEKFFQANPTSTRTVGGCGLGLYLSQNLVRLHGGKIDLLDGDGEETTFVVRLPLSLTEEAPAPTSCCLQSCQSA